MSAHGELKVAGRPAGRSVFHSEQTTEPLRGKKELFSKGFDGHENCPRSKSDRLMKVVVKKMSFFVKDLTATKTVPGPDLTVL